VGPLSVTVVFLSLALFAKLLQTCIGSIPDTLCRFILALGRVFSKISKNFMIKK
jgi:hypothetical protein